MSLQEMRPGDLRQAIERTGLEAGATAVAAAFYDYETETEWSYHGDRWFHAASTIKIAVLAAVFGAADEGLLQLDAPVHVRNRFLSIVDGEAYSVASERDANAAVHGARGKVMKVRHLARHMITTSSNLATNILFDLVGVEKSRQLLGGLGLEGVELRRGVEDEKAFEKGINNRVTANGLIRLLRLFQEERAFSPEACAQMLEILHGQEFRKGIPAGVPSDVRAQARFAHKSGEISTVAHDAGLVFLPNREPYALVVLTEWEAAATGRQETVARISQLIYEHLVGQVD